MLKPKFLRRHMLLSCFALVACTKTMIAVDGQAPSHMRSLSAENPHLDRFEERNFDTFIEKGVLQLEKWSPSLRLRLSSDKEKVINKYFEKLDVKSAKGNLFASEQYRKWARRVFRAYKKSAKAYKALFHELKNHYDDYELATLVLQGLASRKTEAAAKKYHDLQIEDWIANKKDVEVFSVLKLDIDEGSVFKNPLLETYVAFARQLSQTNEADDQIIFDNLYNLLWKEFGYARLAEMLGARDVDLREGSIGNRVMDTLYQKIFRGWPEPTLLSFFKDHIADDAAVTSIWLSLIKRRLGTADYERYLNDLVKSLWRERDVKERDLATVITAAQKDESTRNFATDQLEKLFECWEEEKKTPSDVLNTFGLAKMKAEDIVESPLVDTWFAFESRSHVDDAKLLETLLSQLTEEQLASMIVMKTANPIIKKRVSSVEAALFNKWESEFFGIYGAFVRLKLDKAGDKLFLHPALNVWHGYVVHEHGPGSDELIAQVVKTYYRDPDSLLDMANRELKRHKDSIANGIARILSS